MPDFIKLVLNVLKEQNLAGSGGALGTAVPHEPGTSVEYNKGDNRLPYVMPHVYKRSLNTGDLLLNKKGLKTPKKQRKNRRKK